eukprot:gene29430-33066_t
MFFFPGLNTQPVWSNDLFPDIVQTLKENKSVILAEYQTLLKNCPKSDYEVEDQHKRLHQGNWDWHSYVLKGNRQADFAVHCPQTVSILESFQFPRLMTGTPFSFAFFSTMHPNTRDLGIRIADKTVRWQEGEPIFFDDCYDHEVWNKTNESRVILLFDLWYVVLLFDDLGGKLILTGLPLFRHPELVPDEIVAIQAMFDEGRRQRPVLLNYLLMLPYVNDE